MSKDRRWQAAPFPPALCDYVRGVSFSPDGRWLATGGDDGVVRLWEVVSAHLDRAFAVDSGPDGVDHVAWIEEAVFASAGGWTQCCAHRHVWPAARLGEVVASTAGNLVALDPEVEGGLRWWSVKAERWKEFTLGGPTGQGRAWCLAADRPAALEVRGREIVLVALHDGSRIGAIPTPPSDPCAPAGVNALAVARDGTVACAGPGVAWLRPPGAEWRRVAPGEVTFPCALAFSRDGTKLAVAGNGTDIVDVATGNLYRSLDRVAPGVSIAFAPTGSVAHVAYDGLGVVTWDLRERRRVAFHPMPNAAADGTIEHVVATADSVVAITVDRATPERPGGGVTTWDATTARPLLRLPAVGLPRHPELAVAWPWIASTALEQSPDGLQRQLVLRDGRNGATAARTWSRRASGGIAVHPSGLAAMSERDGVLLLDAFGVHRVLDAGPFDSMVSPRAFSADGKKLLVGDRAVRTLDLETGRIAASQLPLDGLSAAAWSPDGTRIACGRHYDRGVSLWHEGAYAPVELVGHRAPVLAVAFSPDGSKLVTTGKDGQLGVWSAATGRRLAMLPALTAAPRSTRR